MLLLASACGSSAGGGSARTSHTIEIDIDDHGLAGLWMANAPNIKGLIQRGTLAFSRVIIPTHSNQNNMSLLTGQYPDGTNVPSNAWLSRSLGFAPPVSLPGLAAGDYLFYEKNPLRARGDSLYKVAARAGLRTAYFGQLPPFEGTADDVHLTIIGALLGSVHVTPTLAEQLLTDGLHYPQAVVDRYHLDGPGETDEDVVHFTIRVAAGIIRAAPSPDAIPGFMFIWDFLALDDDPTSQSGANGPGIVKSVEQYDAAIGELLSALDNKGLLADTNILFTLDHGKVDTHQQVALGTHGRTNAREADGQLGAAVTAMGPALGISPADYAVVNEDGDAQIYAVVEGAGTPAGAARQQQVTTALLTILQSGAVRGLDVTRTMTADGAMGTRRFHDVRGSGPNQADILVFPADDWTLNQVDTTNTAPGPFVEHKQFPYGRHGGFSIDELYVPLVMAGPAFKQGVLLPHPVEHPEVAATAAWAMGGLRLDTAARGPVAAALANDPGEALPLPEPLSTSRAMALEAAGFDGNVALAGAPATAAVIIDVAGLYDDEVFGDATLADAAAPLRELAAAGVRFENLWTRSRDAAVNEYQLLTGAYPIARPWISMAEDDPAQTVLPAAGLLAMPPPAGRVADRPAYAAWRKPQPFGDESLFAAARAAGFATAIVGQPDFHQLHLANADVDVVTPTDLAGRGRGGEPRARAITARVDPRRPRRRAHGGSTLVARDRRARRARRRGPRRRARRGRRARRRHEPRRDRDRRRGLGRLRRGDVSSRPARRRRAKRARGVVSGQPATPADVPATVLFGLGLPSLTDFADGTRALASAADVPSASARAARRLRGPRPAARVLRAAPPPAARSLPELLAVPRPRRDLEQRRGGGVVAVLARRRR